MKFPLFFENSKIPEIISAVSPIDIEAISLGIAVFSRGKMDDEIKMHETIHYKQWVELGFIGFLILYPSFWLFNRFYRGLSSTDAYRQIPFEIEAYSNQSDADYLSKRKLFAWRKT